MDGWYLAGELPAGGFYLARVPSLSALGNRWSHTTFVPVGWERPVGSLAFRITPHMEPLVPVLKAEWSEREVDTAIFIDLDAVPLDKQVEQCLV